MLIHDERDLSVRTQTGFIKNVSESSLDSHHPLNSYSVTTTMKARFWPLIRIDVNNLERDFVEHLADPAIYHCL
jgi:hypothetical protein